MERSLRASTKTADEHQETLLKGPLPPELWVRQHAYPDANRFYIPSEK